MEQIVPGDTPEEIARARFDRELKQALVVGPQQAGDNLPPINILRVAITVGTIIGAITAVNFVFFT